MLLVICGAGASYDSAPSRQPKGLPPEFSTEDQHRPPLANELFGNRGFFGPVLQKYPQCLPVITRLRHIPPNSSVENELQKLQAEAPEYPERHVQLAAIRYYLQEILFTCGLSWPAETNYVSNYLTLVDDIKRWRKPGEKVCFVTFNYDTILDDMLGRAGFPIRAMTDYIRQDLMLIKLHGSVNWGHQVRMLIDHVPHNDSYELARALIDRYANLEILKPHLMIGAAPPPHRDNIPIVPALAIPVEEKLDFECPMEHVEALKLFLPQVTKILIIGWRGTEKPFLELLTHGLGSSKLQIMIVNGARKYAEDVARRLVDQAGINGQMICTEYGFTQYTVNKLGTGFLSA